MRIGIDLGGTHIAGGLVNQEAELVFQKVLPTLAERDTQAIVDDIITVIEALIEKAEALGSPVQAIGIGVPGLVDAKGEVVVTLTNLDWDNVPLKEMIQSKVKLPVFLENDANAAAYAEWHSGSLKDADVGLLVTLGTGVGGGIVLNRHLYRGQRGLGEFGHMVIEKDGRTCGCGMKGCFEAYASATGLVRTAVELMEGSDAPSAMRGVEKLTPKNVVDLAKSADPMALEAFQITVNYLAIGMNNLINILDPDCIAIGGGLAYSGDFLMEAIQKAMADLAFDSSLAPTPIRFAHYLNDAGIIGAALMTYQ